jgi:hypothetical protein
LKIRKTPASTLKRKSNASVSFFEKLKYSLIFHALIVLSRGVPTERKAVVLNLLPTKRPYGTNSQDGMP